MPSEKANQGVAHRASVHEQRVQQIVAALRMSNSAGAERLARDSLSSKPDDENVLILLGLCLQQQGRSTEAVEPYRRLTDLFPKSALHWNNLGTALRESGNTEGATQAYLRSIYLDSQQYQTRLNLGYLFMESDMYSHAREQFLCAHSLASIEPEARVFAAQMCVALDGRDLAEALVAEWRCWTNLSSNLMLELAILLMGLGHADESCQLLENLIGDRGENYRAITHLAMLYERVNRLDEARALLAVLPALETITDESLLSEIDDARAALALRESDPAVARRLLEEMIARQSLNSLAGP